MSVENFFGHKVNIGSLLEDVKEGCMLHFIEEGKDGYLEMKNFYEMTKDKKCLFDVGCAFGMFSMVFCHDNNKAAHAFDASHQTQLSITQNIALNPDMHIIYHKMFLGESDVIRSYHSNNMHALAVQGDDKVVMIKMDSFCALTNTIPDVIKIDTEGFEYNVLAGGEEAITSYRPLMFIELHPKFCKMYGTQIEQVFELSKKFNYSIRDIQNTEITSDYLQKLNTESLRTIWYPK